MTRLGVLLILFGLAGLERAHGEVLTAIGQNFTGSTYGIDAPYVAPDANGAAGPDHFVEFINGRFSVYAKTNGLRVRTMTDRAFWLGAGIEFDPGVGISDPRLLFDPAVQRWFAASIDYSAAQNSNRFLLAISAGADPTQKWRAVAFLADPTQGNFADFTTFGLDANAAYVGGYLFSGTSGEELQANVLAVVPKADLLGAFPTTTNLSRFSRLDSSRHGHVLQPAVNFDSAGSAGKILAVGDLGLDFNAHATLVAFGVETAASAGAFSLSLPTVIDVPPYSVPINPPQPDGSTSLDDGDTRFSSQIYQVAGVLYAVHSTEVSDRAAIRWYKINAADFSLLESGTLTDPSLHLFYPSIAANASGTMVIGFNGCSSNSFISCYAVVGETVDGMTSFGPRLLLKAGRASYQHLTSDGTYRWGDYSATCVDPNDPNRFWTIQLYASDTNAWSTQITELLTAVPRLAIAQRANRLELSWPGTAIPFALESAPNPLSPNWTPVLSELTIAHGRVSAEVPLSAESQFFRLRKAGPP